MHLILARAIDCSIDSCRVQLLDDGSVIDAPLSPLMIQIGTRIRPEMLVALDRGATPPEIRWRFETRPVEALAGDRITLHGRQFRFTDARPVAEQATPIRVGDTVVAGSTDGGDTLEVYDTVENGRPRHPERLEAAYPQIEAAYQRQTTA
ncbi:MAG TPA: hypothetical protein VIL85_21370 [Thermomicrobiales bacterium]|jgi:hypothetical protein